MLRLINLLLLLVLWTADGLVVQPVLQPVRQCSARPLRPRLPMPSANAARPRGAGQASKKNAAPAEIQVTDQDVPAAPQDVPAVSPQAVEAAEAVERFVLKSIFGKAKAAEDPRPKIRSLWPPPPPPPPSSPAWWRPPPPPPPPSSFPLVALIPPWLLQPRSWASSLGTFLRQPLRLDLSTTLTVFAATYCVLQVWGAGLARVLLELPRPWSVRVSLLWGKQG